MASATKRPLSTAAGSQHQAYSEITMSAHAESSLMSNPHSSGAYSQGPGPGTTAGTTASRVTDGAVGSQQEDRQHARPGSVEEAGGKGGSRWSAVNAYRQAREAAARAAAGTGPCPAFPALPCLCYNHTQPADSLLKVSL